jgi:hypothetical protein
MELNSGEAISRALENIQTALNLIRSDIVTLQTGQSELNSKIKSNEGRIVGLEKNVAINNQQSVERDIVITDLIPNVQFGRYIEYFLRKFKLQECQVNNFFHFKKKGTNGKLIVNL